MACYKSGGCGAYEMYSCQECPASKPDYLNKNKEQIKDTMMRATLKAGVTKQKIIDIWYESGLMGVYDLGMKHMYEYLEEK